MKFQLDGNVTDQIGVPVAGALIYVYDLDGDLAPLLDATDQVAQNPVVSGEDGYFSTFVTEEGFYTLRYLWAGRERYVQANVIAGRSPILRVETAASFAEEFSGPAYASIAAGEAATSEGQFFRVPIADTDPEEYTRYRRTAGGSVVAAPLATTIALASTDVGRGASLISLTNGDNLQEAFDGLTSSASRQFQRAILKLRQGLNCDLVFGGDSTGDATTEWIYVAFEEIAAKYPDHTFNYRAVDAAGDYGAPVTIQTGTAGGSAPVCTIWNASIPGEVSSRFASLAGQGVLRPAVIGGDPDLIVFSYGHNGLYDYETQFASLAGLVGETSRTMPMVPIVIVGQNPVLTDDTMAVKVEAFRALTAMQNLGWLDVHAAFLAYPGDLADLYLDDGLGVHPNAQGSALWASVFVDEFKYDRNAPAGSGISNLNRGVLMAQHLYEDLAAWTFSGCSGVEVTDSGYYETGGSSLKITGDGVSSDAYIVKLVIPSTEIQAYRNRSISASVRIRVNDGASPQNGRIALFDGVATTISANGGPQDGTFFTATVTHVVDNLASDVYLYVYLNNSAPTDEENWIDRFTVSDGPVPRDSAMDVSESVQLSQTSGTFSPTIVATGTDFDSVTYHAINQGSWVRTGNLMHFQMQVRTDGITVGSASGQVAIGGLPVAAASGLSAYSAVAISRADGFAGDVPLGGTIQPGATRIGLYYRTVSNGPDLELAPADLTTGSASNTMILSGTYRVA